MTCIYNHYASGDLPIKRYTAQSQIGHTASTNSNRKYIRLPLIGTHCYGILRQFSPPPLLVFLILSQWSRGPSKGPHRLSNHHHILCLGVWVIARFYSLSWASCSGVWIGVSLRWLLFGVIVLLKEIVFKMLTDCLWFV